MKILSRLNVKDQDYINNKNRYLESIEKLNATLNKVYQGGGGQERLIAKGKLPVRKRIEKLIDKESSFLELSALAGDSLYKEYIPSAGIITGVGQIENKLCMIIANDPTVKGGTYFPITLKKHLRAQAIAEKNHLTCVYLVDSGGAYLPMQDEVFPDKEHFGRLFYNQARMSAKGIQQISVVFGLCTAGGAYIPAMSDQSIIVKDNGTIFLAGPPLVKAATGEDVTAEELGGARVHCGISGVADHMAENELEAILILRNIISHLGKEETSPIKTFSGGPPQYDPEEILGIMPPDFKKSFDIREIIARIVDDSDFFEFKANYGPTLVTGFANINGIPVGVLGNNGVLFSESSLKAVHFIQICCQEKIPLLFLQNITGFIVGKKYEHQGIAKDGAKMVHAVANASVPKITVIVGGSFGAGNYGMCGRSYDPDYLFMWPEAKISVMGARQAASVLVTVKKNQLARKGITLSEDQIREIEEPILHEYTAKSSAYYSTARLWDDGIIDPRDTRKVLSRAFCSTLHYKWRDTKFGVFRM